MSQWFDDDIEESRYRSKLLEFGARRRVFVLDSDVSSDNWELRWRTPLQSEQESEVRVKSVAVMMLKKLIISCICYRTNRDASW